MEQSTKRKINHLKGQVGVAFRFTTTRPVAILMVVIGVVVFGWISYAQLPLNLMPDISYPSLTVRTEYAGTAPEEIETTISRPIEQALGVVNNLVSISSISKAGQSDVKLEFTWGTDMNQAVSNVREMMEQVFLPDEVKRPLLLRYDPTLDPIMRFGVYGGKSMFFTRYLAEENIKRKLETVKGVAAVKVKGGYEEEIRVELDEQKLTLIGIDIQQVKNRLSQENVNLAGGNLREGQTEYLVRTLNEFKGVKEIQDVVVGYWNNREIKVKDIATVRRTNKEREIITSINGKESVEIEINKEADANIVAVAKNVNDVIFGTARQREFVASEEKKAEQKKKDDETGEKNKPSEATNGKAGKSRVDRQRLTNFIAYNLPDGVKIEKLSDQSVFIENSINEVKGTAVIGGLLAVLVLFVFLRNLTATIIVGIAIPISIIATFAPMKIFDVSLNIMSLGGLALGIGMLVDNSIVVLESIARCREEGDNLIQATIRGTGEVGAAVVASTLTTIAVFFPIVFVEGIAGQIFGDMALAVVFSLLASLMVALFVIPMLSSRDFTRFTAGLKMSNLTGGHLLTYSSENKVNEAFARESNLSVLERVGIALTGLGMSIWEFVVKMAQLILVLAIALLKAIVLLGVLVAAFFVMIPALFTLKLPHLIKRFSQFSLDDTLFGRKDFIHRVWPSFLIFESLPGFFDDMRGWVNGIKKPGFFSKTIRILFLPVAAAFYLIKFFLHLILEMLFRVFHFIFVAFSLLLKFVVVLLRTLFAVPASVVFITFNWVYGLLEKVYPRILISALQNRMGLMAGMVALFVISVWGIGPRLGSELIPEVNQGEFAVELQLPVGTPVEQTDRRVKEVQSVLEGLGEFDMVAAVAGADKSATTASEEGEHTAKITLNINTERGADEDALIAEIREKMVDFSGLNWKISKPVLFSFKTPVELEIHGYNITRLQQISRDLEEELQKVPGLHDIKSTLQRGNPEVQIVYDRQRLAKYNLNIMQVASIIRNKVRGDVATEFKERDRRIDILVQLQEEDRMGIDNLRRIIVNPGSERPVSLESVATLKVNEGPSEIRRVDQQRTAIISANISGRDLKSISDDILALMENYDLPDEFSYSLAGQNKEMETSLNSLQLALSLAIFLVYIVMASQFESLTHPFVIIFTIPLALIGVIFGLYLLNIPVSIVVFLGMIMLAGIVVNNAIVLVDYINNLRQKGVEKMEAIVEAGKVRLRPILMTTSTTVLGLLPMAWGLGDGAEIRTPMAITVIVGLIASTVLTLVVIPVVYSLVDRKA